jgi:ABC-2 type transport system ATP-binding protein
MDLGDLGRDRCDDRRRVFQSLSLTVIAYLCKAIGFIIGCMAIIEIENLRKDYRVYSKKEGLLSAVRGLFHREFKKVEAVAGIDLQVNPGEFVAFLGPNGAGKTTTLKLLSGVITPTSGSCRVMGFTPWKRENEYRRRFALVMGQKNQLWWDLPAQESFRLHQHIYQINRADYEKTLNELVELLGLQKLLGRPVRELSLGERMKMELSAALLHMPEVLFLDEPTIGLDVIAQHAIQQFLKRYQEERGITILLTSHYMKDIAALCKRVVVITEGKIKYDGSLDGIIDKFSSHKIVTLQLPKTDTLSGFERFGEVLEITPPKVRIEIERAKVPAVLARILAEHSIEDVVVEDLPLEQVIAQVFSLGSSTPANPDSSKSPQFVSS